jgi:hypothetical protein
LNPPSQREGARGREKSYQLNPPSQREGARGREKSYQLNPPSQREGARGREKSYKISLTYQQEIPMKTINIFKYLTATLFPLPTISSAASFTYNVAYDGANRVTSYGAWSSGMNFNLNAGTNTAENFFTALLQNMSTNNFD